MWGVSVVWFMLWAIDHNYGEQFLLMQLNL